MFEVGETIKSYSKNTHTGNISAIQTEIITKIDDKYIYAQSEVGSEHDIVFKYHKNTLEYIGTSEKDYSRIYIRKLNLIERISLCLR